MIRGTARRRLLPLPALLFGVALALGCSNEFRESSRSVRPSFVLAVVDTLRAGNLHYAGYEGTISPHFDALQRESVWFRNAYATSSWTLPSVASLLVSQLPSRHGMIRWGSRLPADAHTVAETLREAGYRTGA